MRSTYIIGDLHLHNFQRWGRQKIDGLNYRATVTLFSLRAALDKLTSNNGRGCTIIFAGDVFDTNKPDPPLIAALMDMLGSFTASNFYLMTGNHDVGSSGKNDHALAPFKYGPANITVVDSPLNLTDSLLLHPWLVSGSLADSINKHKLSTTKTVVAHGFVSSQPFDIEPNADLTGAIGLNVIAGHVHTSADWMAVNNTEKVSIGAFGPTAFGDDGGCIVELTQRGTSQRYRGSFPAVTFRQVPFAHIEALINPTEPKDDLPQIEPTIAPVFYRIVISNPDQMPAAKQWAQRIMRRSVGGVEIKLEKQKLAKQELIAARTLEDATEQEIQKYAAELKISEYLQNKIRKALMECIQKV